MGNQNSNKELCFGGSNFVYPSPDAALKSFDFEYIKKGTELEVYEKDMVRPSECNAFKVKELLEASDHEFKYSLFTDGRDLFDGFKTFQSMEPALVERLERLINKFLDKYVKWEYFVEGENIGFIELTPKDIRDWKDGKPIDFKITKYEI